MDERAISENAAAMLAIIATVIFATVIFSVLSGLFSGSETLVEEPAFDVDVVMGLGETGSTDTPVIRLSYEKGAPIPLNQTRIDVVDPRRISHPVRAAVLIDDVLQKGDVWYVFYFDHDDPEATDYWITDEPEMVFGTSYHQGIGVFSPPGKWKFVLVNKNTGRTLIEETIDL
ncbi:MAG: hypothetical protein APR53_06885 [Methanoculleus sp. SDB]|nr:MAG: hypothetical protein APR53_06885 [Methanoculleus sp. SDB]